VGFPPDISGGRIKTEARFICRPPSSLAFGVKEIGKVISYGEFHWSRAAIAIAEQTLEFAPTQFYS
jgi:hypothetical protein